MKRFLLFFFPLLILSIVLPSLLYAAEGSHLNKVILVDDFDDETIANVVGGETGSDEVFPGSCNASFWNKRGYCLGNRGSSLRIDYNTSLPNAFAFYYQRLGEPEGWNTYASYPLDLSDYGYLSFWIKTDNEKPRFSVELHQDADGDHQFILGKDITSKLVARRYVIGKDPTKWRKVVIPLKDFRSIRNWSQVLELDILFEDRIKSGTGTIYLDDVLFGKNLPESLSGGTSVSSQASAESDITLAELVSASSYLKGKNSPVSFSLYGEPVKDNFRLKARMPLEFQLKQVPPELESIRFEIKRLGETDWETLEAFYDHSKGIYALDWRPEERDAPTSYELRVVGYDAEGYETVLAGPYKSKRYDKFFV